MLFALLDTIRAKGGVSGEGGGPSASPISVQRETATWTTADKTFTINAVDTSKALARWASANWTPTNLDGDDQMDVLTAGLSFASTTSVLADGQTAASPTGRKGSLEVWELPEGANFGIALRYYDDVSFAGAQSLEFTKDIDLSGAGISDINDCAVLVCSIRCSEADNTPGYDSCFVTAEVVDASGLKLRVTRGDDIYDGTIRLAVLEFTGSNWSVQKVKRSLVAGSTVETGTINAVDWDHAFVFGSSEDSSNRFDGLNVAFYPGATTTTVRMIGGQNAAGVDTICYVVEDTSGTIVCEYQELTVTVATLAVSWVGTFPSGRSVFLLDNYVNSASAANARYAANYEHTGDQAGELYRESTSSDPTVHIQAIAFPATGS